MQQANMGEDAVHKRPRPARDKRMAMLQIAALWIAPIVAFLLVVSVIKLDPERWLLVAVIALCTFASIPFFYLLHRRRRP